MPNPEEKVPSRTCGWLVSHHLWLSALRRPEQQHPRLPSGHVFITFEIPGGKTRGLGVPAGRPHSHRQSCQSLPTAHLHLYCFLGISAGGVTTWVSAGWMHVSIVSLLENKPIIYYLSLFVHGNSASDMHHSFQIISLDCDL